MCVVIGDHVHREEGGLKMVIMLYLATQESGFKDTLTQSQDEKQSG